MHYNLQKQEQETYLRSNNRCKDMPIILKLLTPYKILNGLLTKMYTS